MTSIAKADLPVGRLQRIISNEFLALASVLLAGAALLAIARGQADWARVPPLVWLHLGSILTATLLTPVMLLRGKGSQSHRRIGYVWVGAMGFSALTSLFFNTGRPAGMGLFTGDFSPIHILSVFVLWQVPMIGIRARQHRVADHQSAVRGMVIGALLIAGFFTFPGGRMLGGWLLG